MKKLLLALVLAAACSAPAAYAQDLQVDVNVAAKATTSGSTVSNEHRNENGMASSSNSAHATGSVKSNNGNAPTSVSGNLTAETHRSAVATFVQTLRATAARDGGIGAEVRAVAQAQNDAASTTIDAMTKLEKRSNVVSFFLGTDWKSVGTIRRAIAQNQADVKNLEKSLSLTTNASVRAELEAEIETLRNAGEDLENFVTSHEAKFSLFGWFTKLFVQAEV
jgi:hypothetical protein